MGLDRIKSIVFEIFINSNELVKQSFIDYLIQYNQDGKYINKALKILELNWRYRVMHQKTLDMNLDHLAMPEYQNTKIPEIGDIIDKVRDYDVISFDIFDTLIFRYVNKPKDVFRLLEYENHIMGFAKQREEVERNIRQGCKEITIEEIYQELCRYTGQDIQSAIDSELQMELRVCYGNPYMQQVLQKLETMGKICVATSDMYLSGEFLRKLLHENGFDTIQEVYVSSDIKKTKSTGELQVYVQQQIGKNKKIVHIGDNMNSDIRKSEGIGWSTIHYPNITIAGNKYRRTEMKTISSSIYSALVNSKLHNGCYKGSALYEIGYAYGGILAVGYCQYLKELVEKEQIDLLMFVARDGFILNKIYDEMIHDVDTAYVPYSRYASYQITFERNWHNFLNNVVKPRLLSSKKESLEDIIEICDMRYIVKYLKKYNLSLSDPFTMKVYEDIQKIIHDNINEICVDLKEYCDAAEEYFRKAIDKRKKICVVDIGWQGTCINSLKYFLEEKCRLNVKVIGSVIGAVTRDATDILISSHNIYSYIFSAQYNKDLTSIHFLNRNELFVRNMLMEMLFTEDAPSFMRFEYDENGNVIESFSVNEENGSAIHEIQKGITDYCRDYFEACNQMELSLEVCAREAYVPYNAVINAKKYAMKILGDYNVNEFSGFYSKDKVRKFADVLKRRF